MIENDDPDAQPDIEPAEYAEFNEMRLKRVSPKPDGRDAYEQLRSLVLERLTALADQERGTLNTAEMRALLLQRFGETLVEERIVLTGTERRKLIEDVLGEVLDSDPKAGSDGSD